MKKKQTKTHTEKLLDTHTRTTGKQRTGGDKYKYIYLGRCKKRKICIIVPMNQGKQNKNEARFGLREIFCL